VIWQRTTRLTLFPLTSLATDVKQLVRQIPDLKSGLADPCRLDSGTKNVLIDRHEVGGAYSRDRVEVAVSAKRCVGSLAMVLKKLGKGKGKLTKEHYRLSATRSSSDKPFLHRHLPKAQESRPSIEEA
jgi:hypothetical protein